MVHICDRPHDKDGVAGWVEKVECPRTPLLIFWRSQDGHFLAPCLLLTAKEEAAALMETCLQRLPSSYFHTKEEADLSNLTVEHGAGRIHCDPLGKAAGQICRLFLQVERQSGPSQSFFKSPLYILGALSVASR